MKVHLGGSLAWYDQQKRSNLEIPVREGISLNVLLRQLGIPKAEIAIISINGVFWEGDDAPVCDEDTILLYPPIGGG